MTRKIQLAEAEKQALIVLYENAREALEVALEERQRLQPGTDQQKAPEVAREKVNRSEDSAERQIVTALGEQPVELPPTGLAVREEERASSPSSPEYEPAVA